MYKNPALIMLALAIATPVLAQSRFEMEAKANAARREENKAVRQAEHPEDQPATKTAAAPAAPAPVAPAAPAAAPATPAQPAPAQ